MMSAKLTVFWANEAVSVSIQLTEAEWHDANSKKAFSKLGDGYYYEDDFFQDRWIFNTYPNASLVVEYGEEGGQGFVGGIEDAVEG